MTEPRRALRSLIGSGPPFIAADCYSALTARIVERAGFEAAYMGGHATGMMHYAIPDCGVLTPTEMIDQAARVAEAVSIPVIVDADQAGESVADVHRSIRRYERVGVAGVHIEDEMTPKHSPFDGPLLAIADMQARIAAAVDARDDPDFVVIARCDELYSDGGGGGGSLDEAIRRGVAYAEAGADAYLPTFAPADAIPRIAAEVPLPIVGYGKLVDGLAFSLFTGWGTSAAARAHAEWASHLRRHGDLPPEAFGFPDKDELIDQPRFDRVVTAWAQRTGRPLRPRD
ncbi:MAG TPA: isocitrate lyase/PEP mutase family protein [Acidimicrobiales bacterium]|nr:isocitrate lyase/PEP mutase family protein [Acidimicrobiales bacterium]